MDIVGVATYFGRKEDHRKIVQSLDDDAIVIDNQSVDELEEILLDLKPDLVISDDKIRHMVHKLAIPFLNGRGQGKAYAGFDGFLTFAKDVYETVNVKIWKLAGRVTYSC